MSIKKIAIIPIQCGQSGLKSKYLRLIGGKPLVFHIILSVINSKQFKKDDIYIYSDLEDLKQIAQNFGFGFYQISCQNDILADCNDRIESDIIFQFSPAYPFISSEQIRDFVKMMHDREIDSLTTSILHQDVSLFKTKSHSFISTKQSVSRDVVMPIYFHHDAMTAWKSKHTKQNQHQFEIDKENNFFVLSGFSTYHIETNNDFALAESIYETMHQPYQDVPQYYHPKLHHRVTSEADVPSIIDGDGVSHASYDEANMSIRNLEDILKTKKAASWIHRVVDSESNSACLICQQPGEGNRRHYHPRWNEWWFIVKGSWDFEIEGVTRSVKKGDFVFIPKNSWHKITATGNESAIRLAVSREGVDHVYKCEEVELV